MATPNVVPRADQEGGLGTAAKSWGKLFIENPTAGGTAAATISNLDVDQIALRLAGNNTTANIIDLSTSTLTTGSALFMDVNNSATTAAIGNIINIDFDKSGVISSGLATMSAINVNMNDAATNGVSGSSTMTGASLTLTNSNNQGTITQNGLIISCTGADAANTRGIIVTTEDGGIDFSIRSSADPGDIFTIATTAAGATTMTTIDDDATAAHLNMVVDGNIDMDSADSITIDSVDDITITAGDNATFRAADNVMVSTTSADGQLTLGSDHTAGTAIFISGNADAGSIVDIDAGILDIDSTGDTSITAGGTLSLSYGTAMVFNEDGADADFRIESDDETHMFFLDAGNNRISIGDSVDAPAATLEVTNHATAGAFGVPVVQLNSMDIDQIALDINANNTSADVIHITANDLIAGCATNIDVANSTAGAFNNTNGVLANWDYTKSGDAGSGDLHRVTAFVLSVKDTATGNDAGSTTTLTAQSIVVDSANDNGTNINTGLDLFVTDATENNGIQLKCEDGAGADIKMTSTGGVNDYCTIATGANGATTITTVDGSAADAHLTLDIDGDLKIDNAGGDTFFYTNGNTDDFLQLTIGADGQATFTTVDAAAAAAHIEFAADGNITLDAAGTITFEQASNSASMPASDGKVVVQTTTLKVMPDRFFANGDSGRSIFVADNQTNKLGIHQYNTADELYAHIEIPFGHTVTEVHVYCSDTITNGVTVGAYNYQTGADNNVTTTTGNTNADIALSSNTIAGGATQDLWIKVELGAADKYLWGAKVTLAVT